MYLDTLPKKAITIFIIVSIFIIRRTLYHLNAISFIADNLCTTYDVVRQDEDKIVPYSIRSYVKVFGNQLLSQKVSHHAEMN